MDVQFHEDDMTFSKPAPVKKPSFFTQFAYKLKFAKTEKEAQRIMLIAALACLFVTFLIMFNFLVGF